MHGVDLLPTGGELSEQVVERWVAAALTEAVALRELDDQLYTSEDDPLKLERARRLHAAWRQWGQEAEALLQRIAGAASGTDTRPALRELREQAASARALIKQSPELILERVKQARGGDVMTIEEVRRGLRTGHCS